MMNKKPQILLTNDDGIQSPGLWAAAEALSTVGYVHVVAPREQYSGAGRSLPTSSDGQIETIQMQVGNQTWQVYSIGGTPAQVVLHGLLDILPATPDLVVSGINYGENLGHSIMVSGTVGAAFEAAAMNIPALAVSLELEDISQYLKHPVIDFSTAAHFTAYFANLLLNLPFPTDVDLFKLDVPWDATPSTPWRLTSLGRHRYFAPFPGTKSAYERSHYKDERSKIQPGDVAPNSDISTLLFDRMVSLTPLSLDMTSRVDLRQLEGHLRKE